jgi:hypothetical protein
MGNVGERSKSSRKSTTTKTIGGFMNAKDTKVTTTIENGSTNHNRSKIRDGIRSFLVLFLPTPKPEEVLTPEERARIDRAWDEVFARMAERRKAND